MMRTHLETGIWGATLVLWLLVFAVSDELARARADAASRPLGAVTVDDALLRGRDTFRLLSPSATGYDLRARLDTMPASGAGLRRYWTIDCERQTGAGCGELVLDATTGTPVRIMSGWPKPGHDPAATSAMPPSPIGSARKWVVALGAETGEVVRSTPLVESIAGDYLLVTWARPRLRLTVMVTSGSGDLISLSRYTGARQPAPALPKGHLSASRSAEPVTSTDRWRPPMPTPGKGCAVDREPN